MDFQNLANSFHAPACIVSVKRKPDSGFGEIRLAAGNKKYIEMIEMRFRSDEFYVSEDVGNQFIPNSVYDKYFPKNRIFEEVCFKAAVQKVPTHTYTHMDNVDIWFDIYCIPLDFEDGDICYWKDSKVRTFLNGMFYQRTFSEEEKSMISDTVFTKEDEVFSVKLFIPTYAEVYNQEEKNYRSKATEYAYFNGVKTFDKDENKRHSKGIYRFKEDGSLGYSGYDIYCDCWVLDESQSQITYVTGWGNLAKNYYGYKTCSCVKI